MKKIIERALIACRRGSRHKTIIRSIFLTMRITAAILLIGALQVSARGTAQKISFTGTNVPLTLVFHAIEEQTGYGVLMAKSTLEASKPVTVNLTNGSIDEVMKVCFSFQPWKLTYVISGKTISISKVVENILSEQIVGELPPQISGIVRNEEGIPLAGATIEIKTLNKRGQSNEKGEFILKGVPNGTYKVEITYIGYDRYTTEVTVQNHQFQMIADMRQASNSLDKAEVIAYGITTQRLATGDVSVVTAKDIEKQPVSNPILALEGRVPGLFIQQANGIPGGGLVVRIQGQNSIQNGNEPFYVIDGVPYSSTNLQSYSYLAGGSPLNFINPSNIESISVLKDADATAIYGSRAANGAIIITTKKGKAGNAKVNFDLQNGWGKVTRTLHVLNTQQYLAMRHEGYQNDGLPIASTDYDINGTWDTTRYTDWQKTLIGGTAQYTNLYGSVSGGSANIQYLVGGTYHRESTVFPGNFADQKASIHFGLSSSSTNNKFKFQLTADYLFENNQLPGTDYTQIAFKLAPDAPPLYNSDGSLNWALNKNGITTWIIPQQPAGNPLSTIYRRYTDKNNNLISNAVLSYQLLPGFEIRSNFGYTNQQINENIINPLISVRPQDRPSTARSAQYSRNSGNSWIIEPQVSYKKVLGKGKLDALIGATIQQQDNNQLQLTGLGYSSDLVLEDPMSAGSITASTSINVYKYNALFGRLGYEWNDKYIIDLTGRRDGTSRFGPDNRFHNFGAAGIGWIFSNEKVFAENLSVISFGKIRGSYGTSGNDQIGDYSFLSLYSPLSGYIPYQGVVSFEPNQLTNPYLQWEETKKLSFGLDLGFMKDRIVIKSTYFRNRSSNQLLAYSLPIITGFLSINKNLPATVQNSGVELSINTVNIRSRAFTWSSQINLTIPKNKLIAFPGLANSSYASNYKIGKSIIGASLVYHLLGVNDTTGIYEFSDSKGNATYNPVYGVDNTIFISQSPNYYGGLQNNLTYRGFELDFLFQFVKQTGSTYPFGNYYPGSRLGGNQPVWTLSRWQKPGDHASIQRFGTNYKYLRQISAANSSDAFYTDASYIRLKNLSLSWQFPSKWLAKVHLQNCKLYILGQNLLTITHYKGLDPELPSGPYAGLPPLRIFTTGIQVGL
jgi:TonB-linked SusC/RagA family outer membrane protein